MAKMNKDQRDIVAGMIRDAAVIKYNKQFAKTLKKFKCTISIGREYHNGVYGPVLSLATTKINTAPCMKTLYKTALAAKQYTVKLNSDNTPVTTFNAAVIAKVNTLKKPLNAIKAEVTKFNNKMNTEFVLLTSFSDVNDITAFVEDFLK